MGRWGNGIFEDDLAADLKGAFDDAVKAGKSPADAASTILSTDLATEIMNETPPDQRDDAFWEESGSLFIAAAQLQSEHGVLDPEVRELARQAIAWELGEADSHRAKLLRALGARLGFNP